MQEDIKKKIVERRLERIAVEGYAMGHPVPVSRTVPLVPFDRAPFVICEVKRKSPSKGVIDGNLDAVAQARRYVEAGVKTISVLTEEDSFSGSLQDLMDVKKTFPDTAVLRKDFLVRREDIEVSYRAGADAVLLIASLLTAEELKSLKDYAESLGLAVFVEVHDGEDTATARTVKPHFTGINCRNLGNFTIDRAIPLMTKPLVDWPTRLVFESGIFRSAEAVWAAEAGFQGVLVGEGAVKNPRLAADLARDFRPAARLHPDPEASFWSRLYAQKRPGRPLVKICGLAHRQDAELAEELGADLLGFILAPSKRQVDAAFIRTLPKTEALKVAVVQLHRHDTDLPAEVKDLLDEGFIDALQFHGDEAPALVDRWASRGYKAVAVQSPASLEAYKDLVAPRILADAFTKDAAGAVHSGGTGTRIPEDVLQALGPGPLWLAGGLNPDNIGEVVKTWKPELVDASSGLEEKPGHKDPVKLKHYFAEIENACLP